MTGGGTRRRRVGSKVESWTGGTLGILRRVDGDEDFAPRVLAMAMSAETIGDARDLLRRRRQTRGYSGSAPS